MKARLLQGATVTTLCAHDLRMREGIRPRIKDECEEKTNDTMISNLHILLDRYIYIYTHRTYKYNYVVQILLAIHMRSLSSVFDW